MRWFRDNIGKGSWLALIALAISLTLSFGHIHVIQDHPGRVLLAAGVSPQGEQKPRHHHDGHPDYLCPICIAAAAIGSALAPVPPALPVQLAAVTFDHTIEAVATIPERLRAAFQSRGPPLS